MWILRLLKYVVSILFISAFVILLHYGQQYDSIQFSDPYDKQSQPHIEFSQSQNKYVLIDSDIVEWLNADPKKSDSYKGVTYQPSPVVLQYAICDIDLFEEVESQLLELSQDPDFAQVRQFEVSPNKRNIHLFNLYTNAQYYYRLTVTLSDGKVLTAEGKFQTADTPRILTVDGLVNLRDIGGWKTVDGKQIRQGLLYRGSELDGAVESSYCISEEEIDQFLSELGIRTDLDLRSPDVALPEPYPLGDGVKHTYYDAVAYKSIFTKEGKETIRAIFSDLANPEDYPIYLHCTYGLDRTGTVCYLLELLLGVSEADATRDYCLSILHHRTASIKNFNQMNTLLYRLDGESMAEKVEGYLLSAGVTAEEIASIRTIFLESTEPQ